MPEILPGLHQLKVPIPNSVAYVLPYLFEIEGGFAIIDPGWDIDESINALREQLSDLGIGFSDLRQVIVTHVHPDHYGMAGRIREESDAEIIIHEKELDFLRWRRETPVPVGSWFRRHGMPEEEVEALAQVRRVPSAVGDTLPDRTMTDGELLRLGRFELGVMWTPGHAPGHSCFYEAEAELLLTGDHVLPRISPNVSLRANSNDPDPLGDYLASLDKLRGLSVRQVLPAHEYSFENLEARLDELEEHHRERMVEMMAAVEGGADTTYEIARHIHWSVGHFDKFNLATRQLALGETIAHLAHLVREGRLESLDEDGIVHYRGA